AQTPEWEAQALRLSVFLDKPFLGAEKLWATLTGGTPESDDYRPRELQRRQLGVWQEMTLEVQASEPRLDIIAGPAIGAAAPPNASGPFNVVIGPFAPALRKFDKLVRAWLETADFSCNRLAVGVVVLAKASSRESNYALLGSLVPSV